MTDAAGGGVAGALPKSVQRAVAAQVASLMRGGPGKTAVERTAVAILGGRSLRASRVVRGASCASARVCAAPVLTAAWQEHGASGRSLPSLGSLHGSSTRAPLPVLADMLTAPFVTADTNHDGLVAVTEMPFILEAAGLKVCSGRPPGGCVWRAHTFVSHTARACVYMCCMCVCMCVCPRARSYC